MHDDGERESKRQGRYERRDQFPTQIQQRQAKKPANDVGRNGSLSPFPHSVLGHCGVTHDSPCCNHFRHWRAANGTELIKAQTAISWTESVCVRKIVWSGGNKMVANWIAVVTRTPPTRGRFATIAENDSAR